MRHTIELRDARHRPAEAELRIGTNTVELRVPGYPLSITSRLYLSYWLDDPYQQFTFDETTWDDTTPITLTIGEFTAQLDDETLAPIRADLRGGA